ncbi:MAG: hypothetical protein LQ346_001123 [Caloplaca aetnensis]|nr:MAG: hypothetical protein LQ346_001123 [Caloplaca aetnensis]
MLRLRRKIKKAKALNKGLPPVRQVPPLMAEQYRMARNKAKNLVRRNLTQDHRNKGHGSCGRHDQILEARQMGKEPRHTTSGIHTPDQSQRRPGPRSRTPKPEPLPHLYSQHLPRQTWKASKECRHPRGTGTTLLTDQEARNAFSRVPNNKAPGPDEVPNEVIPGKHSTS